MHPKEQLLSVLILVLASQVLLLMVIQCHFGTFGGCATCHPASLEKW